jgi:DNA polymerase-3 subunit epsilon
MTGGQAALSLGRHSASETGSAEVQTMRRVNRDNLNLRVQRPSETELAAHEQFLDRLEKDSGTCLWRAGEAETAG